jgi:hypothetical protein
MFYDTCSASAIIAAASHSSLHNQPHNTQQGAIVSLIQKLKSASECANATNLTSRCLDSCRRHSGFQALAALVREGSATSTHGLGSEVNKTCLLY